MKINLKDLSIKKLSLNDLDAYLELQDNVKNNMENPDWLGTFDNDDYNEIVKSGMYGFYYNNNLIACGVVLRPTQDDLKKLYSKRLEASEVIDLGPEFVHPDYRGNGLQDYIIKYLEDKAKENGIKYAIVTIHPNNIYSINNLIKNEYKLLGYKEFERGPRNIYRKELY